MDLIITNKDNLNDKEINSVVTRVKIFLINNEKKIIIANCCGCYQLPGGHVEENEDLISTVKREILEETGIELDSEEINSPFLEIRKYSKNHHNSGNNHLSKIIYYYINTNKKPNLEKIKLTEHEKENNFKIDLIPIEEFEPTLSNTINNSKIEVNKIIAAETLNAFKYLEKHLNN